MFCRALLPVRLLGSTLAVCAATLLVTLAPDAAQAEKFGRSFYKGDSGAPNSDGIAMSPGSPRHPNSDPASIAKARNGEAAPADKHDSGEDDSSGSGSRRPSLQFSSDEKSEAKPAAAKQAADKAAASPAQGAGASSLLDKGKKKVVKLKEPHPLAAPHKGMDVTVCEAGCSNEKQQVVYVQPTTASTSTTTAEMKPNSSIAGAAAAKDMILCMGGCYDTPKRYNSTLAAADPLAQSEKIDGSVKPTSARSGDWMRRIDKSRGDKVAK